MRDSPIAFLARLRPQAEATRGARRAGIAHARANDDNDSFPVLPYGAVWRDARFTCTSNQPG
jgi:hypothetical protein